MKHVLPVLALSCLSFAPLGAAPAAEVKGPSAPPIKPEAKPDVKTEVRPLVRAQAVHGRLAPTLAPEVRRWITQEARKAGADPRTDVAADVRARFAGQSLAQTDVDTLVMLVLFEAARDAEKDLKAAVEEMKAANAQKKARREAAQDAGGDRKAADAGKAAPREARPAVIPPPAKRDMDRKALDGAKDRAQAERDSSSEMSEEQSVRMRLLMDRMSKADAKLSEALKKTSQTQGNITQNLK